MAHNTIDEIPTQLISTVPLRERLQVIEGKLQDQVLWHGEDASFIRTARWIVAEVKDAIRKAAEDVGDTAAAAHASGWDPQTLRKYARLRLEGAELPEPWAGLEVRRDGREFEFVLSTVPKKPSQVA